MFENLAFSTEEIHGVKKFMEIRLAINIQGLEIPQTWHLK